MLLKQLGPAAGVCSLATLAACGGGGDDSTSATANTLTPTAAAADKYVGTWSGCFSDGGGSRQDTNVISKTGASSLTANWQEAYYAATGCLGTPSRTNIGVANVTLVGSKTIGTDTVDKADILQSTPGAQTEKQVLAVLNGQFAIGVTAQDKGPVDAQGYPNSLDPAKLAKKSDATTPPPDAADKYVGTWKACHASNPGGFDLESLVVTKTGANSVKVNWSDTYYANAICTGTPTGSENGVATVTIVGTKLIGANTADKIDIYPTGVSALEKNVQLIVNGKMTSGVVASDGGTVDAEGYPNTLDSSSLMKQ